MIYVKLIGGLGNQMFQYAAARSLAKKHGTNVVLDISGYEQHDVNTTPRHYELKCFNVQVSFADDGQMKRLGAAENPSLSDKLKQKLSTNSLITLYREKGFPFDPRVVAAPDNAFLIGYWQSEQYFRDIRSTLLDDFSLITTINQANTATLKQIQATEAVSLHVRRGDYVTNAQANQHHGTKTLDYYRDAISLVAKKSKNPHFFVFSDDPQWCKDNLKSSFPMTYVTENDGNTGYEDLRLMMQCQHNIIANSSFSWWGAWLNQNPKKTVIAPATWFNDPSVDTRDIYAEGWIKI